MELTEAAKLAVTHTDRASGLNGDGLHCELCEPTPAWATANIQPRLTPRQRFLKRTFDMALAVPALLLLTPALAIAGAAVWLESGRPIIYRQQRVGEGGRLFRMYKFRTMLLDAEDRIGEVLRSNGDGKLVHKHPDDPRVTRLGRFLRRTSLDELPQLFNILRGQMSLVGPRPELPFIAVTYEPWQWERWSVPQGITGLWQIRGRSIRPLHLHTEDDLEYIRNYSVWLDLKILLKTAVPVITGTGAF